MPTTTLRTFHHDEFSATGLAARKNGRIVTVCLPARDEASTIGRIVECLRHHLVDEVALVDEVLVLDDHSTDGTSAVAAAAGARVVAAADILPDHPTGPGKGQAMWRSVQAAVGDVIAWCDADVTNFGPRFVVGLLGPLLTLDDVDFVKGFYDRPHDGGEGGGGRVTELVARPLISRFFPRLGSVVQPLAGEYAARRDVLEAMAFSPGYGVDLGLLIELSERFGLEGLVQVDLGVRVHRNRPLSELGPQAMAIVQMVLEQAGVVDDSTVLHRPDRPPLPVPAGTLPPLSSLDRADRHSA